MKFKYMHYRLSELSILLIMGIISLIFSFVFNVFIYYRIFFIVLMIICFALFPSGYYMSKNKKYEYKKVKLNIILSIIGLPLGILSIIVYIFAYNPISGPIQLLLSIIFILGGGLGLFWFVAMRNQKEFEDV